MRRYRRNDAWAMQMIAELCAYAPEERIYVSDDGGRVTAHAPSGDGASGPLGHLGACIASRERDEAQ
jgi:hypothetical protein